MYLLGVSGGPDSMFLLKEYKKRNVVVAHVNYNLRKTSNRDKQIVKKYCEKHNINLEILDLKDKPQGNLESWARKIRYDFFKKIYDKYHCTKLLIGHHKDDFLETALMQQRKGKSPFYFGIKRKTKRNGMLILRPYINMYWKYEILEDLEKNQIHYGYDETNDDLKFFRNKIRKELSRWSLKEKRDHIAWFKMSNKILRKKEKKVNAWYLIWEKSKFSVKTFRNIKNFKKEIIFKYVYEKFDDIKLSLNKINSIIAFIEGSEGNKKFKLKNNIYIWKKDGFIKTVFNY